MLSVLIWKSVCLRSLLFKDRQWGWEDQAASGAELSVLCCLRWVNCFGWTNEWINTIAWSGGFVNRQKPSQALAWQLSSLLTPGSQASLETDQTPAQSCWVLPPFMVEEAILIGGQTPLLGRKPQGLGSQHFWKVDQRKNGILNTCLYKNGSIRDINSKY